ncbi:MAG TPA: septum site-determining protein MinC [Herpetosiphonaceae bacterium]|nr:septum site-determining protein MinC [Herpetosiphonaceae bacterium]
MTTPVSIKGGKDGLRLVLDEAAPWNDVLDELQERFSRGIEFFHGAEITIDTGGRALGEDELADLVELMAEHGLQPSMLATTSPEGRSAGRAVGIATRAAQQRSVSSAPSNEAETGLLVHRTLRSGQVLQHHGHVTLIGDVNPGAEVVASGSIVVWGRLRGTAHAGAMGDTSAVICALELAPTLLRIADALARTPGSQPVGPEMAHITPKGIEVEPWESGKR